jgi:uncharacterized protein YcfL
MRAFGPVQVATALAVGACLLLSACSSPNYPVSSPSSTSVAPTGPASEITVSKCEQDQTDTTQVLASGSITNHSPKPADYNFTIEWYLGSMLATRTSVSQTGVPQNAPLGWTTQAGVASPSAGPYTCRVTRVVKTYQS